MKWNPKLKIDLVEVFNRTYSSKPYEVRRRLRQYVYSSTFQEDFGLLVIDHIQDRTLSGKDKNGESFKGYSKSYRESDTFQIYKGGQRVVDLKLSGEMLASMQVRSSSSGQVTINFVDALNAAKAHGHITGMSGRKGGVVRDFFGIKPAEEDKIMKRLIHEYSQGDSVSAQGRELIRELA